MFGAQCLPKNALHQRARIRMADAKRSVSIYKISSEQQRQKTSIYLLFMLEYVMMI